MATPKSKANVGMTLVVLFLITLVSGIILHLKSHGIIIQPRGVIKVIHWVAGLLMALFACWHGLQFKKMLTACNKQILNHQFLVKFNHQYKIEDFGESGSVPEGVHPLGHTT